MSRRKKNGRTFGAENVLIFLRLHYGRTQQQVAAACGLNAMDISKLERKEYGIQLGKLQKLAEYLGVSLETIIHDRFDLALASLRSRPEINIAARSALKTTQMKRVDNGLKGENLVLEMEREKLTGSIFENAVDANYALDPDFGFDVLSFTPDGDLLYIEVKATTDKTDTPFMMSANEKEFMQRCRETGRHYELHRIYDLDGAPKRIIYTPEDLLKFEFIPNEYIVRKEKMN